MSTRREEGVESNSNRRRCILCSKDSSYEPERDSVSTHVRSVAFNRLITYLEIGEGKMGGVSASGWVELLGTKENNYETGASTLCQECAGKIRRICELCEEGKDTIDLLLEALGALHNSVEESLHSEERAGNPTPSTATELAFRREVRGKCSEKVEENSRIRAWLSGASATDPNEPLDLSMNTGSASQPTPPVAASPASRETGSAQATQSCPPKESTSIPVTQARCSSKSPFQNPSSGTVQNPGTTRNNSFIEEEDPVVPPVHTQVRFGFDQRSSASGKLGHCGAEATSPTSNKEKCGETEGKNEKSDTEREQADARYCDPTYGFQWSNPYPSPTLGIHLGRTLSSLFPPGTTTDQVEAVVWDMVAEVSAIGGEFICPFCKLSMRRWNSVFTHMLKIHYLVILERLGGIASTSPDTATHPHFGLGANK